MVSYNAITGLSKIESAFHVLDKKTKEYAQGSYSPLGANKISYYFTVVTDEQGKKFCCFYESESRESNDWDRRFRVRRRVIIPWGKVEDLVNTFKKKKEELLASQKEFWEYYVMTKEGELGIEETLGQDLYMAEEGQCCEFSRNNTDRYDLNCSGYEYMCELAQM